MTHDSYTTSRGEHCIVEGCRIVDGKHVLKTSSAAASMHDARADALTRTVNHVATGANADAPSTAGADEVPTPDTASAPAPTKRKRRTALEIAADKAAAAQAKAMAEAASFAERAAATAINPPRPAKPVHEPEDKAEDFTPADLTGAEHADVGVDPGTASDIVDVIRAMMQEQPRPAGGNIGPSMLGGCERKIGYQLAFGTTGERDDGSWIARVGTAVHSELDDMFRGRIEADGSRRWFTSTRITKPVRGTIDIYDAVRREVIDFKVVGATTMTKARRGEVDHKYDVQLDVYGVGMIAAGYHVERVAVLFLPKTQGLDKAVWYSRPLNVSRAVEAVERLNRVRTVIDIGMPHGDDGIRTALAELTPSEDYCGSCDAKVAGYCPGVVRIERMPEWPAYDQVLATLEGKAA